VSDPGVAGRILVVDDNPLNLKLVCDVLESEGYAIDRAGDADQAQARLAATVPDLILMDIALPGMDGLTLTRRLREDPRYAGVRIVALTAVAMKGAARKALAAGCDGYITKPIDTRRFPSQVAGFLASGHELERRAPIRVLLIEDDRTDLKLMSLVLAASGLTVRESVSGEGILEAVAADRPDVILLDLRLPGRDGRSIARSVKSDPRTREIPIVAVTAFPDLYGPEEMKDAGCDLCIVKPIDTRALPRTLASLVRTREE
jgi:two-component system cell cycle response regulator